MRLTKTEFKPLNQGLQSATKTGLQSVLGWWIIKCGNSRLQSVLSVGLQSVAKWITKCIRDYIRWQGGLQSAPGLQSEAGFQSELVQHIQLFWKSINISILVAMDMILQLLFPYVINT